METITGLFDTDSAARAAIQTLHLAGIPESEISFIGREGKETEASEGAATGAGIGAVAGGAGGLLTGLGLMAIPGVGPVVAAGWLAATAAGAAAGAVVGGAAGGLIGSLVKSGVDEQDANVYAEGLRRGGSIVTVRTDGDQAETVRSILVSNGVVDIDDRRAFYREEGWERFDETSPTYTQDQIARERDRLRNGLV